MRVCLLVITQGGRWWSSREQIVFPYIFYSLMILDDDGFPAMTIIVFVHCRCSFSQVRLSRNFNHILPFKLILKWKQKKRKNDLFLSSLLTFYSLISHPSNDIWLYAQLDKFTVEINHVSRMMNHEERVTLTWKLEFFPFQMLIYVDFNPMHRSSPDVADVTHH